VGTTRVGYAHRWVVAMARLAPACGAGSGWSSCRAWGTARPGWRPRASGRSPSSWAD